MLVKSRAARPVRSTAKRRAGKSTGASRRTRSGVVTGLLARVVPFLGVASLLCMVAAALIWFDPRAKVQQFAGRPIKHVDIESEFIYLDAQQLETVVADHVTGTFLDVDIVALKARLEENPWVDRVSVSRQWPEKLVIRVIEQQPIARWGEHGFLNLRGDIIRIEPAPQLQHLPKLSGNDRYAADVMRQYLRVGKLLGQHGLELVAVELDDTLAWTLTLEGGTTIALGREQLLERLQAVMAAKETVLADHFEQIQNLDMRYRSGFAVAWKENANGSVAMMAPGR